MKFFKTRHPNHLNRAARVIISTHIMRDIDDLTKMTERSSDRMDYLRQARECIKAYRKEANKD